MQKTEKTENNKKMADPKGGYTHSHTYVTRRQNGNRLLQCSRLSQGSTHREIERERCERDMSRNTPWDSVFSFVTQLLPETEMSARSTEHGAHKAHRKRSRQSPKLHQLDATQLETNRERGGGVKERGRGRDTL